MFAVLGEALMDMVIKNNGQELETHFGGGPLNTALALAKLEEKVYFHYPLSQDYYGRRFQQLLNKNGIIYSCPYISSFSTPLAMVHVDEQGKADYRFYRHQTAERDLRSEQLISSFPENIKAIHTGTLAIAEKPDATIIADILKQTEKQNIITSIDANIRAKSFSDKDAYRKLVKEMLALADIIKCSDDDVIFLYPDTSIEQAIDRLFFEYQTAPLIVVSAGSNDIVAQSQKRRFRFTPQAQTIQGDTIGAGDCFIAGLLHQCHRSNILTKNRLQNITDTQLQQVLATADRVAALNCQHYGCTPPSLSDL